LLEGKNPGEAIGRPSAARAENARLKAQLRKAEADRDLAQTAVEIMGKVSALLEQISESADTDTRHGKR
jgi:transposase